MPVDLDALRAAHPIDAVAEAAGVTLRPSGRRLVGRCPLHDDRRPSFTVYPETGSYYCYGCGVGGDVFDLCGRLWDLDFRGVLARLGLPEGGRGERRRRPHEPRHAIRAGGAGGGRIDDPSVDHRGAQPRALPDPATLAVVDAAARFYHAQLWRSPRALAYLIRRGVTPATAHACRLGYATGRGLARHLRGQRLDLVRAEAVGILSGGREPMAGRVVIPDLQQGRAGWLTGRSLDGTPERVPRYFSLRLPVPLLGAGLLAGDTVIVVEGAFDWLILHEWGLPAAALMGTHASRATLRALDRFRRVYLVLDADAAGRQAAALLHDLLAERAVVVDLPWGVKDPADLAVRSDGREALLTALHAAGYRHAAAARTAIRNRVA